MDELRDTLTLERTILLSLEDSTMQGPIKNNADSIRGSQEEVTRLEKVLKARETKGITIPVLSLPARRPSSTLLLDAPFQLLTPA